MEQDRKGGGGGAAPQISVQALALQYPEDTMESVRKKKKINMWLEPE